MKIEDESTVNKLLEAFQECTSRGEQAKLFLETRNGMVYVNMAVNLSLPVLRPGNCSTLKKKKKKTPSTLRRNQERMEMFLQRKKAAIPSTSTPKSQNAEAPRSASPASSSQAMETQNTAADTNCLSRGQRNEEWANFGRNLMKF